MTPKPSKTGREKIASPIRKVDAQSTTKEETRLQVIAHYNYTGVVVGQSDLSALRLWASPLRTPKRKRANKDLIVTNKTKNNGNKSSIHIKPCNISSSEAHNLRTPEYMRNIGETKIYLVPQLVADNEHWINPRFGDYDLQTHYDNIKQMVKAKAGRAMQKKERERKPRVARLSKWQDAHPFVRVCSSSSPTPHWRMFADLARSAKSVGASHRYKYSYTKTKGIGSLESPPRR